MYVEIRHRRSLSYTTIYDQYRGSEWIAVDSHSICSHGIIRWLPGDVDEMSSETILRLLFLGHYIITGGHQLLLHGGHQLVCGGLQFISAGLQIITRGHRLLCGGLQLITRGHQLLWLQLITGGYHIITWFICVMYGFARCELICDLEPEFSRSNIDISLSTLWVAQISRFKGVGFFERFPICLCPKLHYYVLT